MRVQTRVINIVRYCAWLLIVVLLRIQPSVADQTHWKPPVFQWFVQVADAPQMTARAFRLYQASDEMKLSFIFSNDSNEPIGLPLESFARGVAFQAADGSNKPIDVLATWEPVFRRGGQEGVWDVAQPAALPLQPDESIGWDVVMRRPTGETFAEGTYRIHVRLTSALATIQDTSGKPWNGRGAQETDLEVILLPPRTSLDTGLMYQFNGRRLLRENRVAEAVDRFRQATAADPTHEQHWMYLGSAYLRLGQFRNAIEPLERAVALATGPAVAARLLAHAYVGVREEVQARRALRRGGVPESAIPAELNRLEQLIRKR
jgi:tetratricopeptide (TPR) repeat protein